MLEACVNVRDDARVTRAMPRHSSTYQLKEDGTYRAAPNAMPDVYISDSQVTKILNPRIAARIRANYGQYVCVMHDTVLGTAVLLSDTFKYILGG